MNKYQEAFISIQDNKYMYGTDEQWDLLKELVDRAIPKKPEMMRIKKYDGYNIGICECGHTIDTSLDDCANFCPNCGQALDWE